MLAKPYQPTTHHNQEFADRSIQRIKQLLLDGLTYQAIADVLNNEGLKTLRGMQWTAVNLRQVIHALRVERRSWYGLSARRARLIN